MKLKQNIFILLITLALASFAMHKEIVSAAEIPKPAKDTIFSEDELNEFEYTFIEGLKQKRLGNLASAASLFTRCLEIDPNSAVAMYEMANIHYANRDMTSASLLLEKAISIDNSNKWYKLLLAHIYQERKQFSEATAVYDNLTKMEPENIEFLYSKAVSLSMEKKYQEAIDIYNEIENKTGVNDHIAVAKQQIFLAWGKPQKAFEEIERLIKLNPDEPQYYGLLAELYETQGDKKNALKYYNKVLEMDPENGFVHFSLAGFYQDQGNFAQAFVHVLKAFESDNIEPEAKIQYYLMQTAGPESTDWTDSQINQLLSVLQAKYPDNNLMYTVFADNLIRQEKLKEAREYLYKYLRTDSTNYAIWQQVLFINNDLSDYGALYTDSKPVLELFPDQVVVYVLNAVAALQLKKYDEALAVLEKGEPYLRDNQNMKIQFEIYKAEANYNLNRVEQAFKAFDEVIKLDPDNFMVLNNYAYYLSVRGENLNKAESMSGRVVEEHPRNPTYLDTHAWVLFKLKKYDEAKTYIETALEYGGSENPVLVEHYGDILYMSGEKSKALENWKKARSLGDESEILKRKIKESRYIENKKP